jgi:hypothetical protein
MLQFLDAFRKLAALAAAFGRLQRWFDRSGRK